MININDNEYLIKPSTPTPIKSTTTNINNVVYSPNIENINDDLNTKNRNNNILSQSQFSYSNSSNPLSFSMSPGVPKENTKKVTVAQLHNKYNLKYNINPTSGGNSQPYMNEDLHNRYKTFVQSFQSPAKAQKTSVTFMHNFNNEFSNNARNSMDSHSYNPLQNINHNLNTIY